MGKLLQVQRATVGKLSTTTVIPDDDTIPQNTEGIEAMTIAFTPLSGTSTLYFEVCSVLRVGSPARGTAALFVDTTADAIACRRVWTTLQPKISRFSYSVVSGSTSARTYKVRIGADLGTLTNHAISADDAGGSAVLSSLKITEVEA